MNPVVRIFLFIWFVGVALIGGSLFVSILSHFSDQDHNVLGLVGPLAMLGFGFALVRFGRFLARNEAEFITEFVIETLDGREPTVPLEAGN